ncbi:unnamed protein product [Adineta steineri]|uniref:Uncharacterized protein n=1 Tax=Adineta steineri TaxID=433720 RepID=A0A814GP92_9BILA|nr:unnamed protein product [Adineta steineri]
MANQTVATFLTLPVELFYRILDHQSDLTILCTMRNALITLNLGYSQFEDAGAQRLAEGLRRNTILTTLTLECNKIGKIGAQHLADALRYNMALTTLKIRCNRIDDVGAQHFGDTLQYNMILTTLDVASNKIGHIGTQHLADGLRHNIALAILNLDYNQIGDVGAQHLAKNLRHNTTLTILNLKSNKIGDMGAQYLAIALQYNTTLTTLGLECNEIGQIGGKHLADTLRRNTALTTLNLDYNQIGDVGAQHLAGALRHNTTLTTLNVGRNQVGDVGIQHLADTLRYNTANLESSLYNLYSELRSFQNELLYQTNHCIFPNLNKNLLQHSKELSNKINVTTNELFYLSILIPTRHQKCSFAPEQITSDLICQRINSQFRLSPNIKLYLQSIFDALIHSFNHEINLLKLELNIKTKQLSFYRHSLTTIHCQYIQNFIQILSTGQQSFNKQLQIQLYEPLVNIMKEFNRMNNEKTDESLESFLFTFKIHIDRFNEIIHDLYQQITDGSKTID